MDTIRGAVQPITKSLPAPVRELGLSLLGGKCYQRIVLDVDFTDTECLKLAVSKALGTGIVGVSAIVKLPQLLKLISSQSATGVSFLSYALETAAYVITLAYNARMGNPFSTYGEVAFIAVQNIAIGGLVLHYSGRSGEMAIAVALLAIGSWTLFQSDIVHMDKLSVLQAGAGVLGIASKIPQIYTIWSEGTTGQLSAFAVSYGIMWLSYYSDDIPRSSTSFSAHSHASLPRTKKLMTRFYSMDTLLDSHSTSYLLFKYCTTGTLQPRRRPGRMCQRFVCRTRRLSQSRSILDLTLQSLRRPQALVVAHRQKALASFKFEFNV
jgi:mannose-P-dolichol utilization defect protein 1